MGLVDITPGQDVVNKDLTPKPVEVARKFGANGLHPAEGSFAPGPVVNTQPVTGPQGQPLAPKAPAAPAAPAQAKPEEKPADGKQDPTMAPRFAALAKKEKDLRAKAEALKAQEQKLKDFEAREAAYKQDPMKLLQDFGHTYQGLTERILNDGNPTPAQVAQAVNKDIQALRDEMQRKESAAREAETKARSAAEQQAVADFKTEIADFVKADPDSYELTTLYGQQDLIYQTIEAAFKENGTVMPLKEAADKVEEYLWNEANKFMQTKRFQAATRGQRRAPTPGISHSMQPQPAAQQQPNRLLSEEERKQRTLEALAPFFHRR